MYYRTLTCHCNHCISEKWTKCNASAICGKWISHHWQFVKQSNVIDNNTANTYHTNNYNNTTYLHSNCNYDHQQSVSLPPTLMTQQNFGVNNSYNHHHKHMQSYNSVRNNPLL